MSEQMDPFTGKPRAMSRCCNQAIVQAGFMSLRWAVCSGCQLPIKRDKRIEHILMLFPEVTWDRFSVDESNPDLISIFGWVERPQDSYMDYVQLDFDYYDVVSVSTSSARYSADFSHRLGFGHNDCQRVEDRFKIPNMIRLNK